MGRTTDKRPMKISIVDTSPVLARSTAVEAFRTTVELAQMADQAGFVVESAERVVKNILATYSAPNLTPQEIQPQAGKRDDALREFSITCRRELESLQSSL